MTQADQAGPDRYRFLASFIAERPVDVAGAGPGEPAYTDGQVIFVSAGDSVEQHRREVLVQSALLGAGSLERRFVSRLRARPSAARRYLLLEGYRVLAALGPRVPSASSASHLAAAMNTGPAPPTVGPQQSLEIALGKSTLAEPPDFFGAIRPSRLLKASATGSRPTGGDVNLALSATDPPDEEIPGDDDDEHPSEKSRILKLFERPAGAMSAANFMRKLFGTSRSTSETDSAGADMSVGSMRRSPGAGAHARPLPTPIRFQDADTPGAAVGFGGALHPEWDVYNNSYREDWCRVIDFPMTTSADIKAADAPRDEILRRRLARVGLGPKVLRARADGDDLDTEALIDLFVDLRSGHSPPEHVYTERRKLARNLGVMILVDASGSATDADTEGQAVHEHQRRAAATLTMTLEELGDRVAVYAFHSQGRNAVHLLAIKPFPQRFGIAGKARLNQLQPSGYTRLGAAIRGAGEILKEQGGTPNRLLLVLSDGFPYDHGYEGRYAEADTHKALEELRADGVACLCLSIGAAGEAAALEAVFGSASHASGATLAELSPRMDELFLAALDELAAPKPQPRM